MAAIALKRREYNVGTVVIVEDTRSAGIVTDRDLALALGAQGISVPAPVQKVMPQRVLAIPEDTGIDTATKLMREREVQGRFDRLNQLFADILPADFRSLLIRAHRRQQRVGLIDRYVERRAKHPYFMRAIWPIHGQDGAIPAGFHGVVKQSPDWTYFLGHN